MSYGPALPPGYSASPVVPNHGGIPGFGRNVLSADGSVRFTASGVDPQVWRQLQQSPDGNRPVAVSGPHAARSEPAQAPAPGRSVPGWVGALANIVGGFIPGVGEALDAATLIHPDSSLLDRGLSALSLAVNIFTAGAGPNFGSWGRAGRKLAGEAVSHLDEAAAALRGLDKANDARRAAGAVRSFKSSDALKGALGPAGDGRVWHHIVEQRPSNIARFGPEAIHNTQNVVAVSREVSQAIANYYSSKRAFTGGKTVREWLDAQSYEKQRAFGEMILRRVLEGKPLP